MNRTLTAAVALVLLLAAQAAFGLATPDGSGQAFQPLRLESLGGSLATGDLPVLYLYQPPKEEIAPLKPGLLLYGGATSMALGGGDGSVYKGGLYFSRSAINADPLAARRVQEAGGPASILGLKALMGSGRQLTTRNSAASWQELALKGSRFSLAASHKEVASDFEGLSDVAARRSDAAPLGSLLGMKTTNLDFNMQPVRGMALTSHYDKTVNDKPGDQNRGLTQMNAKHVLDLALGSATKLTGTYEQTGKLKNRNSETKEQSTFVLSHDFGGGLLGSVTRQLTTTGNNGNANKVASTLSHFEYKPTGRFGLKADIAEKRPQSGNPERSTVLDINTLLGQGKGELALTGQWQGKTTGEKDKNRENTLRLGLKADKNPLLQMALNYQSLNARGPSGARNDSNMDATITSNVSKYGRLVGQMLSQTAGGKRVKQEQRFRFELTPGALAINAGYEQKAGDGASPAQVAFGQMLWKLSKPLAQWAKDATGPSLLPAADRRGLRTNIPWAAVPESGVEMRFITRSAGQDNGADTRMLGYQTMLGRSVYAKFSLQENPMQKEGDKEKVVFARRNLAELGMRLSPNLSVVGRAIKEQDLQGGSGTDTRVLALRAQPSPRVSLLAGRQDVDGSSRGQMSFLSLQWKGSAMPDWARNAASNALFPDAEQFGYRKPPAWAGGESGLQVQQFMSRTEGGASLDSYVRSYQTMLGRHAYVKFAAQQNPLDDKNKVIPVRQSMWEMGGAAGRKWTLLLRGLQEQSLDKDRRMSSYILGMRSNLSQNEKLEATLGSDTTTGEGACRQRTVGLEYSRWVNADHMLSFKGLVTDKETGRDDLKVELAYRKQT